MNPQKKLQSSVEPGAYKISVMKIFTILIMFIVLEISLQLIIRIRDGKWLYESLEGSRVTFVKLVKDRRKFTLLPGYSTRRRGLKINDLGFREGPYPVGEKNYIIVNAGDSVPFGLAVGNQNTYPYLLGQLFHENAFPVNVINTGIPSYNSWQSFERLQLDLFPHYDLSRIPVITLQAANDVFLLILYRDRWTPDVTYADERFLKKPSFWQKLASVHYAKLLIKKVFGEETPREKRRKRRQNKAAKAEKNEVVFEKYDGTKMLKYMRHLLDKELSFYRDHSVYFILMPIDPFYYQLSGMEKNPGLKRWKSFKEWTDAVSELVVQYNQMLIEMSHKFDNVFFLDTRPLLDARDRNKMYVDHMHYSPEANKIVARALFDLITQKHLLPDAAYPRY